MRSCDLKKHSLNPCTDIYIYIYNIVVIYYAYTILFVIVNVSCSCNFDSDLCNWDINNDSKTYFRWKRCRGRSCDGPYVDHTLGSSEYKVPLISYYGILFIRWEAICS